MNHELRQKTEDANNYDSLVASLEEKNHTFLLKLEQNNITLSEKDIVIGKLEGDVRDLTAKNEEQKYQVNQLVEKVSLLAEDNMKSCSERSKHIEKGETFISKINHLNDSIQILKDDKSELEKELNSVKEIHLSFLESCNQAINPGMKIGDDFDIEFVQNGIINNLQDLQGSMASYQKRHDVDQQ